MKKQKGITLIALIITIIVMLILVGVSINVALNDGLFESAKKASGDSEKESILEQIVGMAEWDNQANIDVQKVFDKVVSTYGRDKVNTLSEGATEVVFEVIGKTGKFKYKITTKEIKKDEGEEPADDDSDTFKRYVLGEELTGRLLSEISSGDGFNYSNKFKSESTTIPDAETSVKYLGEIGGNNEYGKYSKNYYAEYKGKAYKIVMDPENYWMTKNVEVVYEPTGKEGQDLGQVLNDSQYSGWRILYDHGNGTYEAVSPTVSTETLSLGNSSGDTEGIQETVNSYNNAITNINEFCETLTGLPQYSQIRSVGSKTGEDPTSETDEINAPEYRGTIKKGDMALEDDVIRMSYWDVLSASKPYGIASRVVYKNSSNTVYSIRAVVPYMPYYSAIITSADLITLEPNLTVIIDSNNATAGVRPVITVQAQ